MTTIAYRDGVMAGDSLLTMGDTKVHGNYRKIRRIGSHLVGIAGGAAIAEAFIEWLHDGGEEGSVPPKGDYSAIIVNEKGRVREIEGGLLLPKPVGTKFYAIGSGAPYALAAMYAGADALSAVKIAAKIDTSTGLPVRSLKI